MDIEKLNQLSLTDVKALLGQCCATECWINRIADNRPYKSNEQFLTYNHEVWLDLSEQDYLQAFQAHPKIGDTDSLHKKYAQTKTIASREQASVKQATEALLFELTNYNNLYQEKFGFIFIVCATGKSADEMLALLKKRIENDRRVEIKNAANEQMKITLMRLEKLL